MTFAEGAWIFLAPDCIALVVDGLAWKKIELQGDPTSLLWFYKCAAVTTRQAGQPTV